MEEISYLTLELYVSYSLIKKKVKSGHANLAQVG